MLRKENDDKINAITEKSTQIFTLQSKLTNLTTQYESLKLLRETNRNKLESSSPSQTSRGSPPQKHRPSQTQMILTPLEIPSKTKRKSKENLGFIDKHIIRPIRGGFLKEYINFYLKFEKVEEI